MQFYRSSLECSSRVSRPNVGPAQRAPQGCVSGLGICYLRLGDERSAVKWLRRSLELNPRSPDMERIVSEMEVRSATAVLRPRIREVLANLRNGGLTQEQHQPPTDLQTQVRAQWEVFRVHDLESWTYYFRIRIQNLAMESSVACTARYYAMQSTGGSVFPLSRVLGTSGFVLGPMDNYRYSFMLTLAEELEGTVGGLLMRCGTDLFEVPLEHLRLWNAPDVNEEDLDEINDGFQFMGRLEIRLED